MMKKGILVYNPISHGGKLCQKSIDCATRIYKSRGIELLLHPIIPSIGGFSDLKEKIVDEKTDHILIAGGDGTLRRYLEFCFQNGIFLPTGIIPAGTANDYAGSVGISDDIEKAILQIADGNPFPYDTCCINGGYFLNVFSSGYLTCVSHTTSDRLKKRFGRAAYFLHGIREAVRPKRRHIEVTCDGHHYNGKMLLILVLNGQTAGRMCFAKGADVSDGLLDVRIFTGKTIFGTIAAAARVFMGMDLHTTDDIICFRGKHIRIDGEQHETDIDGDNGPSYPVEIECRHGSLQIIR